MRKWVSLILVIVGLTLASSAEAASIKIPRLGLDTKIQNANKINKGPAWWPRTNRPGERTTVAIAGHRTTHSKPFYYLNELRKGDLIKITYRGHKYVYKVTGSRVRPSSDLHMADATPFERLILSACTPRGSASHRILVYARPVRST